MSFVRSYLKKNIVWVHLWLVLFWLAVGIGLRFTNLESKPPWADEWATLVFSLGHGFRDVPLDQIISLDTLLLPVKLDSTTHAGDVVRRLMQESTHPPLYFILTHQWLKLFSPQQGLVSIAQARSLSALFGVLGIPAIFGFSWLLSRSLVVSQIAAGLMAVSPYGIYLAQETRHYTFAILWVMASLSCLIVTVRHLHNNAPPPNWLMLVWVLINSIGVATHYFFALTLVAEAIVLLGFGLSDVRSRLGRKPLLDALLPLPFRRIGIAMLGTFMGCAGWIFAWRDIPDNQLTDWIQHGNPLGSEFFEPIGRLIAWITTMVLLLPIENTSSVVVTISSVFLAIGLLWLIFTIVKYLAKSTPQLDSLLLKQVILRFILAATLLVLAFAYGFDRDLTLAARFQFFYFPAVLLLVAVTLADNWQSIARGWKTKSIVIFTLLIGFLGGLTVIDNYGYTKPDRPDIVVPVMMEAQQLTPQIPVLVATVHKNHEQTGEIMGIAWEWQKMGSEIAKQDSGIVGVVRETVAVVRQRGLARQSVVRVPRLEGTVEGGGSPHERLPKGFPDLSKLRKDPASPTGARERFPMSNPKGEQPLQRYPKFLLLHKKEDATVATRNLYRNLDLLPRPLDIWLINFAAPDELEQNGCSADEYFKRKSPGYRYRLYHCL